MSKGHGFNHIAMMVEGHGFIHMTMMGIFEPATWNTPRLWAARKRSRNHAKEGNIYILGVFSQG